MTLNIYERHMHQIYNKINDSAYLNDIIPVTAIISCNYPCTTNKCTKIRHNIIAQCTMNFYIGKVILVYVITLRGWVNHLEHPECNDVHM